MTKSCQKLFKNVLQVAGNHGSGIDTALFVIRHQTQRVKVKTWFDNG